MSVWLAIPSKRPPEEAEKVLKLWRERGYKIALALDEGGDWATWPDFATVGPYRGYAPSVNELCAKIMIVDEQAEWIVSGGDDVEPDPNHSAEEIANECSKHFYMESKIHPRMSDWAKSQAGSICFPSKELVSLTALFGVMQPTGDRWGENAVPGLQGAYIDRVCGSPWMGREFCRRMYQGNGPLFSGYRHMFEDEELQNVAQRLGVLWQRPDLTHHHRHWGRKRGATEKDCPDFLREVNSGKHWAESKALFEMRKAGGFPGHEPIA